MLNLIGPQRPTHVITYRVGLVMRHLFPLRLAGIVSGLPRGRAEEWFARGERGEKGFVEFRREIVRAEAEVRECEQQMADALDEIRRRAADGDKTSIALLRRLLELPEWVKDRIGQNRQRTAKSSRRPRKGIRRQF